MIFSILQAIIGNLPFVPASLSAVLALFLEITSGSAAVRLLPLQLCLKTKPDHGWHSLPADYASLSSLLHFFAHKSCPAFNIWQTKALSA